MTHDLHTPVMLQEVVEYLAPAKNKKYLDATLGAGGHTLALLKKGASVVGVDQDKSVIEVASKRITDAGYANNFSYLHDSFAHALTDSTLPTDFDGALFDLGVSSLQLDTPERGFSFRFDAPLDMRMNPSTQQVTAKDLINGLGRKELYELFHELGEERSARRLADAICGARRLSPIQTTRELAEIIEGVVPRAGHIHPATRVFQALRMAVNSEREELKAALPSALSHLKLGGNLAVISFHSGEDKLVKSQYVAWEKSGQAHQLTSKPLTPSSRELADNPRARSAKLRLTRRVK